MQFVLDRCKSVLENCQTTAASTSHCDRYATSVPATLTAVLGSKQATELPNFCQTPRRITTELEDEMDTSPAAVAGTRKESGDQVRSVANFRKYMVQTTHSLGPSLIARVLAPQSCYCRYITISTIR